MIDVFGTVQIGGPVATIAEIEQFVALVRSFGATDDTPLMNGFLAIEFVGTPTPVADGDTVQALLPLGLPDDVPFGEVQA